MKHVIALLLSATLATACSYDEELTLCRLTVVVDYQKTSFGEPTDAKVRVELRDRHAQIFVDSTQADRTATFMVPPGVYEASTTAQYVDSTTSNTWWRYMFNGVKSQIVVSPDSTNRVQMEVKVSRKRIVH